MIDIICADVLDWCESYSGSPFMAILCDPSYGWKFMNREWDSDIALKPETWIALAEHLYPGAFLMAFGGPRTYHRLACALEDAGLTLHPPICHVQGQGFPKATNLHSQLEKTLCYRKDGDWFYNDTDEPMRIKPPFKHPDADKFWGHRYGLQALKPSVEMIAIAQKPYAGRPVDCIVDTGAGALWIDGARVGLQGKQEHWDHYQPSAKIGYGGNTSGKRDTPAYNPQGRWPPNFALVHCPPHLVCQQCQAVHPIQPVVEVCPDCGGDLMRVEGCKRVGVKRVKGHKGYPNGPKGWGFHGGIGGRIPDGTRDGEPVGGYGDPDGRETVADWDCADACPARRLGEQTGESGPTGRKAKKHSIQIGMYGGGDKTHNDYNDKGTAARFYPQASWEHEEAEQLAQADPVHYQPKAPKRERNSGLDDFYWKRDKSSPTGFVRVSKEEWEALPKRQRARGNIHPTQKPIALTKWLATLLLPPPEYAPRRIMVPFGGKMSEAIGALLAGWEEIVAIEMYQDYCDAGEARAAFWSTRQLKLLA